MEQKGLKYYLSIMIELQLFPSLKACTEGSFTETERNQIQQSIIINFINRLPEDYRNMPNRDKIIIEKLETLGLSIMWGKKKTEEIQVQEKLQKMQQEKQQIKSVKDEQEK